MHITTEANVTTTIKTPLKENVKAKKAETKNVKIQSRFGGVEVDLNKAICFENGLLGIPNTVNFCLTSLPGNDTEQFKLLQCLDDHELSFIVVPAEFDNKLIEPEDMLDACNVLSINKNNLLVLFIVTVHVLGKERRLSVNAKAPVFIDALNKRAAQYVLASDKYEIQHMIS